MQFHSGIDKSSWGRLRCTDKDYYLQDVLGSVVGMTDERGNQREEYCYDVWGNRYDRQNRTNSNHTDNGLNALPVTLFGFNGKKFDPKVGLYDFGFRDYKPDINRWTTIDPIRSGKNWYAYVGNDPVNWVDPLGLDDVFATYNRETETMNVTYVPKTQSGGIDDSNIERRSYHMANNVTPPSEPTDKTLPGGENYYRQDFPSGTYNMKSTSHPVDNEFMGTRSIQTDATQDVDTYTKTADGWTKNGTAIDEGYSIHGGGYTGDPMGANNENDKTQGCIRGKNADVEELANWVDKANISGGDAKVTVKESN